MSIILPPGVAPATEPIHKLVVLKTRAGQQLSMPFTLQDEHGRASAAEYLDELHDTIRQRLNEPVLQQPVSFGIADVDTLKKKILYIASFHDAMFGTFNRDSSLPAKERAEFIELFLLAVASVMPYNNILIDLAKGTLGEGGN